MAVAIVAETRFMLATFLVRIEPCLSNALPFSGVGR